MKNRINAARVAPELLQAMVGLEERVAQAGLEPKLRHLVKIRASQINGCAYCVHMHSRDARAEGESEEEFATRMADALEQLHEEVLRANREMQALSRRMDRLESRLSSLPAAAEWLDAPPSAPTSVTARARGRFWTFSFRATHQTARRSTSSSMGATGARARSRTIIWSPNQCWPPVA